jgi:hypothetical protein
MNQQTITNFFANLEALIQLQQTAIQTAFVTTEQMLVLGSAVQAQINATKAAMAQIGQQAASIQAVPTAPQTASNAAQDVSNPGIFPGA